MVNVIPRSGQLGESLSRMTGLLLAEEPLHTVLELVVQLTQHTVASADGVSVTLNRHGSLSTAAHSAGWVLEIDRIQYDAGAGPCILASEIRKPLRVDDLATDSRWTEFGEAAANHGVRSALAIPFVPMDDPIGALNMYSIRTSAFDEDDLHVGQLFARQAGIVLANSQAFLEAQTTNGQLREALDTRDVIGQAKGILMVRHGVGPDEAFEILRRQSQDTNRKLRDIAQDIVDEVAGT